MKLRKDDNVIIDRKMNDGNKITIISFTLEDLAEFVLTYFEDLKPVYGNTAVDYSQQTEMDQAIAQMQEGSYWITRYDYKDLDGEWAWYTGRINYRCPYCDTADITPIKSDIPGAPDTCPQCGGWLS